MDAFRVFPTYESVSTFFYTTGPVEREACTADRTMEQTGEPVLAGRHVPPISRAVFLIQAFLRRFKAISDGGTYFVGALKRIPIPFNRTGIEFIMQDPGGL